MSLSLMLSGVAHMAGQLLAGGISPIQTAALTDRTDECTFSALITLQSKGLTLPFWFMCKANEILLVREKCITEFGITVLVLFAGFFITHNLQVAVSFVAH